MSHRNPENPGLRICKRVCGAKLNPFIRPLQAHYIGYKNERLLQPHLVHYVYYSKPFRCRPCNTHCEAQRLPRDTVAAQQKQKKTKSSWRRCVRRAGTAFPWQRNACTYTSADFSCGVAATHGTDIVKLSSYLHLINITFNQGIRNV